MSAAAYGPYPATLDDWHDGDTAHVTLDLGFGLHQALSMRCYGINAPELNTPEGKAALAEARQLIPPGTQVQVTSHGWDKYGGRFLGEIPGFAEAMIAAHAARAYFGVGPKA